MTTYNLMLFCIAKKACKKFSQLPYSSSFNQTSCVYPVIKVTKKNKLTFFRLKPVIRSTEPLRYLFHKQCRTPWETIILTVA